MLKLGEAPNELIHIIFRAHCVLRDSPQCLNSSELTHHSVGSGTLMVMGSRSGHMNPLPSAHVPTITLSSRVLLLSRTADQCPTH